MSLDACAQLVQRGDPDRWKSLMAVPVAARARLLPVYAFNLEVARAPWVSPEPMIAQMRLQWWRDALAEIAAGEAVRRHEVATPLAEVLTPEAARRLDALVVARHKDLEVAPFWDEGAVEEYLGTTGGGLLIAAAAALGAEATGLEDAGFAGALAAWLRAVPELTARGRDPMSFATDGSVADLAKRGLQRWRKAQKASVDARARPALLALWQTPTILRRAQHLPQRVSEGRLDISPARRDLSLLYRQALGRW